MKRLNQHWSSGCSSVVEHELPKLGVEGSIPFTRSSWSYVLKGRIMSLTIWHNPRCSKSRQTLALLEEKGLTPVVRLYLEDAPSVDEIRETLSLLSMEPRELMRRGEADYKEQGLDAVEGDALIEAMNKTPKLIERPIVFNEGKAKVGRPPEGVLDIL